MNASYLTINIILNNNTYGLTNDAKILCKYLEQVFYKKNEIKIKVRPVNYFSYETGRVDINFFLEIPNPLLLHYAKINILIPNQEWFYKSWIPYLDDFDFIWCKTKYCQSIFSQHIDSKKVVYLGWTSIDRINTNTNHKKQFLHLAGKSQYKGTQNIIDNWDPEYPELIIVCHSDKFQKTTKPNITYLDSRLTDEDLTKIMNESYWHLCLSECEGFGHYIFEALSCKSIVISTDSQPMSDFINKQFLVAVDKILENNNILDNRVIFDKIDFDRKIKEIVNLDDKTLLDVIDTNRKIYINNQQSFRNNLKSNVRLFQKLLKKGYNPKIPREITTNTKELPCVSVITLTKNRKEFSSLMQGNFTGIDYPRDKLEWIIIDDSDDGTTLDLKKQDFGDQLKYIKLEKNITIGEKRNLGISNSKYDYICFMDDDDIYFPRNLLIRLAYLDFYNKKCCYCSTIGSFHINKIISHINVPPFELAFYDRASEASFCFKKEFWQERNFEKTNSQEGSEFLKERYKDCVEIPWKEVFISLLHNKNISQRIVVGNEPNGCHFELSDELFTHITNLQK